MFQTRVKAEHIQKVISKDFQEQWLDAENTRMSSRFDALSIELKNAHTYEDLEDVVTLATNFIDILRSRVLEPHSYITLHRNSENVLMKVLIYFQQCTGCMESLDSIPRHVISPRDLYLLVSRVSSVIPRAYLQALAAFCIMESCELRKHHVDTYINSLSNNNQQSVLLQGSGYIPSIVDLQEARSRLYSAQYAILNEIFDVARSIQLLPHHIAFRFFCVKLYSKFYVSLDEDGGLTRAVQFLLGSFIEMNRMWVRMGYQPVMSEREAERRDYGRMQMGTILTDSFAFLTQLIDETSPRAYYCSLNLILQQAKMSSDPISAATILEGLAKHVPFERHLQEFDLLLDAISSVPSGCGAFCLILERLEHYIREELDAETLGSESQVGSTAIKTALSNSITSYLATEANDGGNAENDGSRDTTPLPESNTLCSTSSVNHDIANAATAARSILPASSGKKFELTYELLNDIFAKLCCAAAQLSRVMAVFFDRLRKQPDDNTVAMAAMARNSVWSVPITNVLKFGINIYPLILRDNTFIKYESEENREFVTENKQKILMKKIYDVFDALCRSMFPYIAETQDYANLISTYEKYSIPADRDAEVLSNKEMCARLAAEREINSDEVGEESFFTLNSNNGIIMNNIIGSLSSGGSLITGDSDTKKRIMDSAIENTREDLEAIAKIITMPLEQTLLLEERKEKLRSSCKSPTQHPSATAVAIVKVEEKIEEWEFYKENFEVLNFCRIEPVTLLIKYFLSKSVKISAIIGTTMCNVVLEKSLYKDFYTLKKGEEKEKADIYLSSEEVKELKCNESNGRLVLSMCAPLMYTNAPLFNKILSYINIGPGYLSRIINNLVDSIYKDKCFIETKMSKAPSQITTQERASVSESEKHLKSNLSTLIEITPAIIYASMRNNLFKDVIDITRSFGEFRPIASINFSIDSAAWILMVMKSERRSLKDKELEKTEEDFGHALDELITNSGDGLVKRPYGTEHKHMSHLLYDSIANTVLIYESFKYTKELNDVFNYMLSKVSTLRMMPDDANSVLSRFFNIARTMFIRENRPQAMLEVAKLYAHFKYYEKAKFIATYSALQAKMYGLGEDQKKLVEATSKKLVDSCNAALENLTDDNAFYSSNLKIEIVEPKLMKYLSADVLVESYRRNEERKRLEASKTYDTTINTFSQLISSAKTVVSPSLESSTTNTGVVSVSKGESIGAYIDNDYMGGGLTTNESTPAVNGTSDVNNFVSNVDVAESRINIDYQQPLQQDHNNNQPLYQAMDSSSEQNRNDIASDSHNSNNDVASNVDSMYYQSNTTETTGWGAIPDLYFTEN